MKRPPKQEQFEKWEMQKIREWFGVMQDCHTEYLREGDYVLADKIYGLLGMRTPNSITGKIKDKPQPPQE